MASAKDTKKGIRISEAAFTAGAARRSQIPEPSRPEIAFAGRSNVGKSSLLNMMLARKGLARTSRTPGCTRQINFFDVTVTGGPKVAFVDLPGYGFAKVSKAESREWKILLEDYLRNRETLEAVVILVDARRGVEDEERELVEFLSLRKGLPVFIAVTKLDKLGRAAQKPTLAKIAKEAGVKVVGTSAETGIGREELWKRLLSVTTHRVEGENEISPADSG
ncbi:MAG: YihA family ribosome biogenesis GTP-binding protein [Deltaproteobacteria bacterium]|nr:YihA family ribosome biogenesis GTP-binding protein [Deltaproteobacteria bacterium]